MGLYDLADRLNWKQAMKVLGCSKSSFFRLVKEGKIKGYGALGRYRFYLRSEIFEYIKKRDLEKQFGK